MNFDQARAAVFGRMNTVFEVANPTVPVQYENRLTVDLATQEVPFVVCELAFGDGEQVNLGLTPQVRYRGAIYLSVWAKEGEGSTTALGLLSALATDFKPQALGSLYLQAARPMPGRTAQGWYVLTLRVPFYFDDQP